MTLEGCLAYKVNLRDVLLSRSTSRLFQDSNLHIKNTGGPWTCFIASMLYKRHMNNTHINYYTCYVKWCIYSFLDFDKCNVHVMEHIIFSVYTPISPLPACLVPLENLNVPMTWFTSCCFFVLFFNLPWNRTLSALQEAVLFLKLVYTVFFSNFLIIVSFCYL